MTKLLEVRDLAVEFKTPGGVVQAVNGISYDVEPNQMVAIVGESGSGKSVGAMSILGLIAAPPGRIVGGEILFNGRNLLKVSQSEMQSVRGSEIGMIFQEPMTSLNPVLSIEAQITEVLIRHRDLSHADARTRAIEVLEQVGIGDPQERLSQYPHQLSGGMRQRVMIAMALACEPKLIIADEPTTALDVTIQAQILELMKKIIRQEGVGMVFITHNFGIVARYADRVNVMYGGKIVESSDTADIYRNPAHPYTLSLLRSIPRLDRHRKHKLEPIAGEPPDPANLDEGCPFRARCSFAVEHCRHSFPPLEEVASRHQVACWERKRVSATADRMTESAAAPNEDVAWRRVASADPLVSVQDLKMHFPVTRGALISRTVGSVKAVDGVSFDIARGETLGLVGESGCGKTTVLRCLMQLEQATTGQIRFGGEDLGTLGWRELRAVRQRLQIIFQDPSSSLNPRMKVADIIDEPIRVHRIIADRRERERRVQELLDICGLNSSFADRYPHEMSGGQRQRVGIARALATNPEFIICDEAVSALDVSIQAQIVNLLEELRQRLNLTYLFVGHDLSIIHHLCHRVAVMYLGRIVELASTDELFRDPLHPYTRLLLDAVPIPDPQSERDRTPSTIKGELPSPLNPPSGCPFHPRCPAAVQACQLQVPELRELRPGHWVACTQV